MYIGNEMESPLCVVLFN